MSIGMTYDEFWHGPPEMCRFYREAERHRIRKTNIEQHRAGLYMMQAIGASIGNAFLEKGADPISYFKEPIPLTEDEQEEQRQREWEREEELFKQRMMNFAARKRRELENAT